MYPEKKAHITALTFTLPPPGQVLRLVPGPPIVVFGGRGQTALFHDVGQLAKPLNQKLYILLALGHAHGLAAHKYDGVRDGVHLGARAQKVTPQVQGLLQWAERFWGDDLAGRRQEIKRGSFDLRSLGDLTRI